MESTKRENETSAWVRRTIRDFCATSPDNSLHGDGGEKAWGEPLVGFSRGEDPLYRQFKKDIGSFLWTPEEIFNLTFPERQAAAEQLTVVSYVLPQTEATRADQRRETDVPSERWSRSRFYGEAFNVRLREHLVDTLGRAGIEAVAPDRSPLFAYRQSERFGLASNWSERHAAFVAGLGTFGLSDGLITPLGKAVRCGSVVARLRLPPTFRSYDNHQAWCLYHARGTCRACARRCPVGAITAAGHDKAKCYDYIRAVTAPHSRERFGIDATPCGLCQVAIPCESQNPMKD
jgi:epoxyqueuosine reductase QueG